MSLPYFLRFADLLTDDDIIDLVAPFKAERRIITTGAFSTSFTIPDSALGAQIAKIISSKTVVYAHAGDQIIGVYIIWSKKLSRNESGEVTCSIQGSTMESYFYRRLLDTDLTYTGIEQTEIALNLVAGAMTGTSTYPNAAGIGLEVTRDISGVARDRSYLASDNDTYGDLLENLASVDDGFEYTVDAFIDGSVRTRNLRIQYPSLRSTSQVLTADEPGDIVSWSVTDDGTQGYTRFRTRGKADTSDPSLGSEPIVSAWHEADSWLTAGYPLLDASADYTSVTDVTTLDEYAAWWQANRSGPLRVITLVLDPRRMNAQGFSPFSLGCTITARLNNPAYPTVAGNPGLVVDSRMIGFDLDVSSDGEDTYTIVVESDFDPTEVT